jgi:N-acetyl-anhydromuramyl-L-alanine amidase AmpD
VHPEKGLGGEPCILVHNTGSKGQPFSSVVNGLTANRVSATSFAAADTDTSVHYIVSRRGHVVKMIDEHYTAFHGDPGIWEGHPFMNFRSVGIEILNSGSESFTELQMRGLLRLIERLTTAFGVERRRVLGHGEINHQGTVLSLAATNRVAGAELNPFDRLLSCPGRRFPWPRLSDRKLTFDRVGGLTSTTTGTTATPDDLRHLKQRLARLGYTVSSDNRPAPELDGNYDEATQRSYTVFQFRWHDAPADRPRSIVTDAPDKETVDAVVAAIDTIQP